MAFREPNLQSRVAQQALCLHIWMDSKTFYTNAGINEQINSSYTFTGVTLANLGFTTNGLIATWTLNSTGDAINVVVGAPVTSVPSPLPLFGAGAAFGWSRRLRKRIAAPLSTPPQA